MANYWIDFMSMVKILMMNDHAIHTYNWEEYLISLREMMPWLVADDQTNYVRWLPDFWAKLTTLNTEQTQFFSSNFAQSMTGKPYSSIPWDKWIEQGLKDNSDEQAIQDLLSCFKEYNCLPFNPASQTLQSAIPAMPELIQDFKKAKQDGEAQLKVFMEKMNSILILIVNHQLNWNHLMNFELNV